MKINSYSVPTIVVNNKITGDRVGCVLFSYEDLLSEVINDYYAKGGLEERFLVGGPHALRKELRRCS